MTKKREQTNEYLSPLHEIKKKSLNIGTQKHWRVFVMHTLKTNDNISIYLGTEFFKIDEKS